MLNVVFQRAKPKYKIVVYEILIKIFKKITVIQNNYKYNTNS